MTRHERTIIAAEELPPIDAAETAREINPRFDVAQIATRGHVNAARIEAITKLLIVPAILWAGFVLLASFGFVSNKSYTGMYYGVSGLQKGWLQNALTYSPDNYFDLGGGLKGGPDLRWLGSYPPTPESLTVADYSSLIAAVRVDAASHGTDAASWEAVGGLKTAPTITRPAKVFADNSADLKNGIVAVPEDDPKITIAAYVDAQWAFAVVFRGQCVALVGPVPDGCNSNLVKRDGEWNSQTVAFIQSLKPTKE